jgi:dipeptidyl aminopeptidase/acylaminoacyl peptidase
VILEAKGVSWNFFPLEVPKGSTAQNVLAADASAFVFVLPGFRGETLKANGKEHTSEGDPAESWDGAADDAIAFLNVALERAPAADPARITAFGRSRGGTVALLVGARDPRIRGVLAWSAPAGWIEDMPQRGFTQREVAGEGLRRRSAPRMIGGQSVRTFLRPAIEGRETLRQVRDRLIASSPIYFVKRLPRTEAFWGADDPIVESANGRRLRDAAAAAGVDSRVKVFFHAEGGHDLDPALARPATREFLLSLAR